MQFLTPEVIVQIASFLGLDKAVTQKAAGGAVPALLAGLSDLVATPAGTGQLSKLLSQQQLGSPADLLRSAGPQALAESGSSMLSSLFGGRTMDAMAQAVGNFAGTGGSGGKLLLSVLGPIVLGALGHSSATRVSVQTASHHCSAHRKTRSLQRFRQVSRISLVPRV